MKLNERTHKLTPRILAAALAVYDIFMLAVTVIAFKTDLEYPFGPITGIVLPMFVLMPVLGIVCGYFAMTTPSTVKGGRGFLSSVLPIAVQLIVNLGICAIPLLGLAQVAVVGLIMLPILSLLAALFGFALPFMLNKAKKSKE